MAEPTVYNHDIAGMYRRLNRFLVEIIKSVSSGGSQTNSFDQGRIAQYIGAIRSYHAWVMAQPQLDLPETAPRLMALAPTPEVPDIENESLWDVCNLLALARDELVNSQSARNASGLMSFDSNRFTAVVDKIENLLVEYIGQVTPLDLPESSPSQAMTGAGRVGV